MGGASAELELRDYMRVIRRRLMTVVLVAAAAVLVSGYMSFFVVKPTYQSQATLIVVDKTVPLIDASSFTLAEQLVQTYATLGTSQSVMSQTVTRYKLSLSTQQLADLLTVTPITNTDLITVQAKGSTSGSAAAIANDVAQVLAERAQAVTPGYDVKVVDPAVPSPLPVSPNKKLNMGLALVLGIIAGIGLGFLQEYLDRTIHDPHQLAEEIGLPVLGTVPMIDERAVEASKVRAADAARRARVRA